MVLVGAILGGLLFLRHEVQTTWADLRAAAADLDLPDGYEVTNREERGTAFCVITCSGDGEATILVTVEGPVGASPCDDLAASLAPEHPSISSTPTLGRVGCLFADLPEVGGDAYLQVTTRCTSVQGGLCAEVIVSSGIE
jgi:hypothetical protein